MHWQEKPTWWLANQFWTQAERGGCCGPVERFPALAIRSQRLRNKHRQGHGSTALLSGTTHLWTSTRLGIVQLLIQGRNYSLYSKVEKAHEKIYLTMMNRENTSINVFYLKFVFCFSGDRLHLF